MRLLLVEDHRGLRDMLESHLRGLGYATDSFERGADALVAARTFDYALAVLDLGLPDLDGMEVLRRLRRRTDADLPVILLTARDGLRDRIDGLDAGADDYILKPFDLDEFDARLRSVLRRPGRRRLTVESFGDVSFDTVTRTALVRDEAVPLSRREACLLEELLRVGGRTAVRDALEERIYGINEQMTANALEAVVSRLRRRLAAAGSDTAIETVRGIGYRLLAAGPA